MISTTPSACSRPPVFWSAPPSRRAPEKADSGGGMGFSNRTANPAARSDRGHRGGQAPRQPSPKLVAQSHRPTPATGQALAYDVIAATVSPMQGRYGRGKTVPFLVPPAPKPDSPPLG